MTAHKVVKRDFQVPLLPLSKKNVNNWVKLLKILSKIPLSKRFMNPFVLCKYGITDGK